MFTALQYSGEKEYCPYHAAISTICHYRKVHRLTRDRDQTADERSLSSSLQLPELTARVEEGSGMCSSPHLPVGRVRDRIEPRGTEQTQGSRLHSEVPVFIFPEFIGV